MRSRWIKNGIVVALITIFFLAPFSGVGKVNKAFATNLTDYFGSKSYIKINSYTSNSVTFSAGVIINPDLTTNTNISANGTKTYDAYSNIYGALDQIQQKGVNICYKKSDDSSGKFTCYSWYQLGVPFRTDVTDNEITSLKTGTDKFKLEPNTKYTLRLVILEGTGLNQNILNFIDFSNNDVIKDVNFTTSQYQSGDEKNTFTDTSNSYNNTGTEVTSSFGCSAYDATTWFSNCVALFLYKIIFVPLSIITYVSAKILDFFIYYSTNSSSYSSDFISGAWGAVRDIANILFILVLLYIAVKTILGLNVSDNKKLISMVIIIALVINFSLFTTQLVIDGSNILAKVFYNNISSVDTSSKVVAAGMEGEKSISVGLVRLFDPQVIVGGKVQENLGQFVVITLAAILIMAYMIYIFLSVALLFVGRVVGLWISMIFSPIAFVSYTVKFDIPGFGHKEWWSELIKNALLAPIFIFFLYIIILFGDFLTLITYDAQGTDIAQTIMKTIIPFIIVYILLKKAKELAVKYSGEIGAGIMSAGKLIGGAALGAGAGIAAFGLKQSVGRVATNLSESERFRDWAARSKLGAGALKMTSGVAKGGFDIRGIKVAGKSLASTGLKVDTFGKAKEGGFAKARAESVKRKEEFTNKLLDTSDFEMAKMIKGKMSYGQAKKHEERLVKGGMSQAEATDYGFKLMNEGLSIQETKNAAKYLSATKRSEFADRLEGRKFPGDTVRAVNMKNRITANKIRKDAQFLKNEASLQHTLSHLAHELSSQTGGTTHGGTQEHGNENPGGSTHGDGGGNEHGH